MNTWFEGFHDTLNYTKVMGDASCYTKFWTPYSKQVDKQKQQEDRVVHVKVFFGMNFQEYTLVGFQETKQQAQDRGIWQARPSFAHWLE